MNSLKKTFPVFYEIKQLRRERKELYQKAFRKFEQEKPFHGSLSDYKKALNHHRVSYEEYMYGYEWWKLNEKERDQYITQREMWCIYRKTIHANVLKHFADKVLFLKTFNDFIHRGWIMPKEVSFEEFEEFVSARKCIAKPIFGEMGKGIFLIEQGCGTLELYNECKNNNYLVEERIKGCDELTEFHPESLNTIRVVTMSGKGKCEVLGALLRMGIDSSFVDNTSSGGIVVPIDVQTGVTRTDGFDLKGKQYKVHPNSGKKLNGFQIPNWNNCLELCRKASAVVPETYFAGWDICVLPNGDVEIIEGNSAPDFNGGIQTLNKGLKYKIRELSKDMLDFDPISLISIWSRSYKKYD